MLVSVRRSWTQTGLRPTPDAPVCAKCHAKKPTADHDCAPTCQLCGLDHPTANKDYRKNPAHRLHHYVSRNEHPPSLKPFTTRPTAKPNQRLSNHRNGTSNAQPNTRRTSAAAATAAWRNALKRRSHNAQRAAAASLYGSATQGGGERAYHVTSGGSSGRQLQIRIAP
ncbi:hypothetical protein HPB47_013826 [Ixodes persulcatus]|uniref:Uncharacterized protein n=1 Tax=Ixodes persulcatus TaxID=34615 RepID=A0AC60R0V4_IXOPE|nr:hypothetical protein HPB47_013826 [Ixodes persulcatus]